MAFDEAKYRAAAKAAGYSDEEIDAAVGSTPVAASAPPPAESFSDAQAKAKADYDAKVQKMLTTNVTVGDQTYEIPSFFTSPAGIVTAAGAGIGLASTIYGAATSAPKAYNAIKDRWISKAPAIDRSVDIPFEGPTPTLNAKAAVPEANAASEWDAIIARSEQNKAAKAADAAARAGKVVIEAPVVGALPSGAPAAPDTDVQARNQAAQFRARQLNPVEPPPPPPTNISNAVANGGNVGQAVKQTVANLVDETPAPSQKPVYPKGESLKAIPPGFVFREDVGNLDRSLGNILGKEHREYARELFNQGKPFGHSADLNNDVSKLTNEYWQRLQSEMPESLLDRAARRSQNVQSDFGTFSKNTNFGQKAKFAGKLGTLFAVSDLVNAKTPEQKANAGVNLLGSVLPPGMDISDAGAPVVPPKQISNAALLGSPYAQTDWAQTQRLREKAQAGRGTTPASAYKR